MRIGGLIVAGIGLALTILSYVLLYLWQDDGSFYRGLMISDGTVFFVAILGIVAIVAGLFMAYGDEHEHGHGLGS